MIDAIYLNCSLYGREVLGESKGSGPQDKESWWNENVQQIIKDKRT